MEQRDIEDQRELLGVHRRRLAILLAQRAHFGAYVPVYVVLEIEDARAEIARSKAILRGWGVAVADHPDDQPPAGCNRTSLLPASSCSGHNLILSDNTQADIIINGDVYGSIYTKKLAPEPPRQLPPFDAQFVGHDQLLGELRAQLTSAAAIIGIDGPPGMGKTSFAVQLAHLLAEHYPDGQIYLPLHGASAAERTPAKALRSVINAFEPKLELSDDLDDLAKRYRSLLSRKRVLILADDLPDPQHLEALKPPAGNALIATSSKRFFGRASICWRTLDPLPTADAALLLQTKCPRLSETEATQIAALCDNLPLALCISAGRLQNDPGYSIAHYIAKLSDEKRRLDLLNNPDDHTMDIDVVLTVSQRALSKAEQSALVQLGVFAADFDYAAANAIIELPAGADSYDVFGTLRRHNLLFSTGDDRSCMHNLVRSFARRQISETDPVYLRYARHYARHLQAYSAGLPADSAALEAIYRDWAHIEAGWTWATANRQRLDLAALLLIYAQSALPVFDRLCPRDKRLELLEPIPDLADRAGDHALQTAILIACGDAALHDGDPADPALAYYERALALAPDERHEARALLGLGMAAACVGDLTAAIPNYMHARSIARVINDLRTYCLAQSALGNSYVAHGRIVEALTCVQDAMHYAPQLDDQRVVVKLLRDYSTIYLAADAALDSQSSPGERSACRAHADDFLRRSRTLACTIHDLEGRNESYRQQDLQHYASA